MANEAVEGGLNIDPMHQFDIKYFFDIDLGIANMGFTNSALFAFIAVAVIVLFLVDSGQRTQPCAIADAVSGRGRLRIRPQHGPRYGG